MDTQRRVYFVLSMFLLLALYIAWDQKSTRMVATPAVSPAEMSAQDLATFVVLSADGERIGPVESLTVDSTSAATHYVIVRLKDIYAFGKGGGAPQDRFLVIPWSHVRLDPAHHEILLDVDAVAVTRAPTFDDLPDTVTPAWDAEIQTYWAQQ
jgi:sporulation protein YlmC with PRC-barrel domain